VTGRLESDRFKNGGKQGRMLEAGATPTLVDPLALQPVEIEANRPAKQHVEVLERNF